MKKCQICSRTLTASSIVLVPIGAVLNIYCSFMVRGIPRSLRAIFWRKKKTKMINYHKEWNHFICLCLLQERIVYILSWSTRIGAWDNRPLERSPVLYICQNQFTHACPPIRAVVMSMLFNKNQCRTDKPSWIPNHTWNSWRHPAELQFQKLPKI